VDIFKFIGFRTSRRPGFIHFRICASYGTFNAKRDNTAGCGANKFDFMDMFIF